MDLCIRDVTEAASASTVVRDTMEFSATPMQRLEGMIARLRSDVGLTTSHAQESPDKRPLTCPVCQKNFVQQKWVGETPT